MDMKRRIHKRRKMSAPMIIVFILFVIYSISILAPFIWMFINSFKSVQEYNSGNYFGLPKVIKFSNIVEVLKFEIHSQSILSMFITSIILTVTGTVVNVFFSAVSAYVIAKYKFPGRKIIYSIAIITMIIPIVGTLPAMVRMMETFGLDDSILGVLFLYSGCFGFNFVLLHSSFKSISWQYAEAAIMDGANRFQIMFLVMFPIAKGPIVAVSVLEAIAIWNDYSTPFLFMKSNTTLAVGLEQLQTAAQGKYPLQFAATMIAVIPIVILFAIFQKTIIRNTVAGGLKG